MDIHQDNHSIFLKQIYIGWGHGFTNKILRELQEDVVKAQRENMDRWSLRITENQQTRQLFFSNYFGIGVDAKIVADFHSCRFKGSYNDYIK